MRWHKSGARRCGADGEGCTESVTLLLPEGHKDLVPFLMDNNLLRHDGLGVGLILQQVVFAHKHPVGQVGAGGERADVGGPTTNKPDGRFSAQWDALMNSNFMIKCVGTMRI